MSRFSIRIAALVVVWFVVSLGTSADHLYQTGAGQPPLALGLAVLTPVILFSAWFAGSRKFRDYIYSLHPGSVTMIHSWRTVGFVFLALAAYGLLPKLFALTAGLGDIAMGATASLVARKFANPERRRSFILWQLLGVADLVTALTLATLSQVIDPQGIPTTIMTVLPMSLVPTFAVPLFMILHIISIAQARRWPVPTLSPQVA